MLQVDNKYCWGGVLPFAISVGISVLTLIVSFICDNRINYLFYGFIYNTNFPIVVDYSGIWPMINNYCEFIKNPLINHVLLINNNGFRFKDIDSFFGSVSDLVLPNILFTVIGSFYILKNLLILGCIPLNYLNDFSSVINDTENKRRVFDGVIRIMELLLFIGTAILFNYYYVNFFGKFVYYNVNHGTISQSSLDSDCIFFDTKSFVDCFYVTKLNNKILIYNVSQYEQCTPSTNFYAIFFIIFVVSYIVFNITAMIRFICLAHMKQYKIDTAIQTANTQ